MKKVRNLMVIGTMAFVASLFSACGGGSNNAEAEAVALPTDGILGELPKVVAEFEAAEAAVDAKYEKLKNDDPEKAKEFLKEYMAQGNRTKFKKETLPAVEKTLEGKEIPAEVAAGLPLKLDKNFVLDSKRNASTSGVFTPDATKDTPWGNYKLVAFDVDGNPISIAGRGINVPGYIPGDGKPFSATFFISVDDYSAAGWARLQKIVIMDKDSEAFKQAEDQIKAAKDAFKNKGKKE
jgi:hypothetical protein